MIYEAWISDRPIFNRLPGVNGAYSENAIADYLTGYWDELLVSTRETVEEIEERQLDPLLCDPQWLDFLAPLLGWDAKYWDKNYPIAGKRQLLNNSYQGLSIWENKGTRDVLSFVLTQVGVMNRVIIPGDFLINISHVGDLIGTREWEYTIILPVGYAGQDKEKLTRKIRSLFAPAWCDWDFIFNDDPFIVSTVMIDGTGKTIATETNKAIEVSNGL